MCACARGVTPHYRSLSWCIHIRARTERTHKLARSLVPPRFCVTHARRMQCYAFYVRVFFSPNTVRITTHIVVVFQYLLYHYIIFFLYSPSNFMCVCVCIQTWPNTTLPPTIILRHNMPFHRHYHSGHSSTGSTHAACSAEEGSTASTVVGARCSLIIRIPLVRAVSPRRQTTNILYRE